MRGSLQTQWLYICCYDGIICFNVLFFTQTISESSEEFTASEIIFTHAQRLISMPNFKVAHLYKASAYLLIFLAHVDALLLMRSLLQVCHFSEGI